MQAAAVSEAPYQVFWAPGCTSCLRTKEYLKRQGIPFESINVRTDPQGMAKLQAIGASSVPIVARGERFIYAQSLEDLKAFLGLDAEAEQKLAPAELIRRADIVLAATARYMRQMSAEQLDGPFRNSWAPPRGIGHHVFRIAEAYLEAVETPCELTYEMTMRGTYEVKPGDDVISYGEGIRARLNAWWQANAGRDFSVMVPTYYGEQTLHEVLERTTWHSAQHTRQLIVMVESFGLAPDQPLTPADLAGLPLPEKAWDTD
jgi:glutaredoxin